jgi:hypothetical protein
MQKEEISQVRELIVKVQAANWKDLLASTVGNQKMEQFIIGGVSAKVFLLDFEKAMSNLRSNLRHPIVSKMLPVQFSIPEYVSGNLINMLQEMLNGYQAKDFNTVIAPVQYVIAYQIHFGIWFNQSESAKNVTLSQIREVKQSLDILENRFSERVKSIEHIQEQTDAYKAEFQKFLDERKSEIEQIAQALLKVRIESDEVTQIKGSVEGLKGDISGVKTVADNTATELKTRLDGIDQKWNQLEVDVSALNSNLTNDLQEAGDKLKKAKEDLAFIESKRADIIGLVGLAADGSLGHTYRERAGKVGDSVSLWLFILGGSVVGVIAWVVVVFTYLHETGFTNQWVSLLINVLKTTPAFIGLGFVFRQYNKERNIQEEYAFRSAVALTINAYADLLDEEKLDAQGQKSSRAEMLLRAIGQVHTPPKLYSETPDRLFSFSTKHIADSITNLNETVKTLKGQ